MVEMHKHGQIYIMLYVFHLLHYPIISQLDSYDNKSASLTKATDGVGVGLSLQLDGGLLWLALLMVTQLVTLNSHRSWGGLPACHNGGAVKRLKLKSRG